MLALPDKGFRLSVNAHNSDLMTAADWVEGTVLFQQPSVSKSDVTDFLEEQNIYRNDSHSTVKAIDFASSIWTELEVRAMWLGRNAPYSINGHVVARTKAWDVAAGHAFCLLLTFAQQEHKGLPTGGWITTGELFERFAERCLRRQGWRVLRTGWESGINTAAFQTIVSQVAAMLNEEMGAEEVIEDFERANEEGLDLAGHHPFPDGRRGVPAYLVQCASGANWKQKVTTPNLDLWRDFIAFSAIPNRCFCFPVALSEADLRVYCRRSKGLFMDRYRLLHRGGGLTSNLTKSLGNDILTWCQPRVAAILAAAV